MGYHAIILTDTKGLQPLRPLGAYCVANALRTAGYNVLVIDHFARMSLGELLNLLSKHITDETLFLGYSSSLFLDFTTMSVFPLPGEDFVLINKFAKAKNSSIKIIYGGSNSKNLLSLLIDKQWKNNLHVDYVMHGYSDSMIVDFIKSLELNKTPKFSNVYKNSYGTKLYVIDYDYKGELFNFHDSIHRWHHDDFIMPGESLPLEIARGCIFRCKFCAYPLLGKNPKDNSYIRKEEHIFQELKENYEKYKTNNYVIVDDTFNERTDKIELLLRVRDRLKIDLTFTGYNRLDLIARKPEQLPLLKNLNFVGHFFGIESLNYESAKSIGKGLRPEEIIENLYKIRDFYGNNLSVTAGLIIGLPYETPDTFFKWSETITQDDFPIDNFLFNPLTITATTHTESEFFKNPEKYEYEYGAKGQWKNDIWSHSECREIANQLRRKLIASGRQRWNAFSAAGLTALGYEFSQVIKTSRKNIPDSEIKKKLSLKIQTYVDNLKSL